MPREAAVGVIEAERALRPFDDLADFLRRTRADVDAAESRSSASARSTGSGLTDAGRPPTRDEQLALLPELKAVLAREGVAGDRTLVLAPATARARDETDHVSGWSVPRAPRRGAGAPRAVGHVPPARAAPRRPERARRDVGARPAEARGRQLRARRRGCASARRRRGRARAGARASSRWRTRRGCSTSPCSRTRCKRCGETIVKHRVYLVEGMLQNNAERGLAIVARQRVMPYLLRAGGGEPVRLRRGVGPGADGTDAAGRGRTRRGRVGGARRLRGGRVSRPRRHGFCWSERRWMDSASISGPAAATDTPPWTVPTTAT